MIRWQEQREGQTPVSSYSLSMREKIMKINFEISQETFDRIQKELNGKLTDEVINKGIDAVVKPRDKKTKTTETDYTHTKILEARVNGENIEKPSWRSVVIHMLKLAGKNKHNIDRIKEIFPGATMKKEKQSEYYIHIPEIDRFIHDGIDAPSAARAIKHAADTLGFKIYIKFQWHDKPESSRPGKVDCIEV